MATGNCECDGDFPTRASEKSWCQEFDHVRESRSHNLQYARSCEQESEPSFYMLGSLERSWNSKFSLHDFESESRNFIKQNG